MVFNLPPSTGGEVAPLSLRMGSRAHHAEGLSSWLPAHLFLPSLLNSEQILWTGRCARCQPSTVVQRASAPRNHLSITHNGHLCLCSLTGTGRVSLTVGESRRRRLLKSIIFSAYSSPVLLSPVFPMMAVPRSRKLSAGFCSFI